MHVAGHRRARRGRWPNAAVPWQVAVRARVRRAGARVGLLLRGERVRARARVRARTRATTRARARVGVGVGAGLRVRP